MCDLLPSGAGAPPVAQPDPARPACRLLSFSGPRWWTLAMRALSALLQALTAALVITGCSGPGSVQAKPPAAPIASPPRVGCDQTIQQTGAPGGRIVLGVLAVPPAHLPKAVPSGSRPWRYFRKYGLAIRAGSPAVQITQIPGHDSIAAAARVLYQGRA